MLPPGLGGAHNSRGLDIKWCAVLHSKAAWTLHDNLVAGHRSPWDNAFAHTPAHVFLLPHRSTVFLMPSVNCLVELTEMPFTVTTLADVEIVNLERVGFNLKNFDMAIVFKDFTRDVCIQYLTCVHDRVLLGLSRVLFA